MEYSKQNERKFWKKNSNNKLCYSRNHDLPYTAGDGFFMWIPRRSGLPWLMMDDGRKQWIDGRKLSIRMTEDGILFNHHYCSNNDEIGMRRSLLQLYRK